MAPNAQPPSSSPGRDESRDERADRNFVELLQGFRVAVTGVQVLFAFLLTVPFSQNFGRLGDAERLLYLVALVAAARGIGVLSRADGAAPDSLPAGDEGIPGDRSNIYGSSGASPW